MTYNCIALQERGPVGWFLFNRPPVNAVDRPMLDEIVASFEDLLARPAVRVVVIASAIDRYFNAGADMAAFKDATKDELRAWIGQTHRLARLVRGADKPVLAAINGVAVGGGLEMALHADLRFAAADARLGQPEINIAFIPPIAGTQALVRLVGRSQAFRILYGGALIPADEALRVGLVDFVTDRLADDVQAYAENLAHKPANALAAIRRCLVDGGGESFDVGLDIERAQAEALVAHPNFEEGVAAFLEKRTPNWTV